MGTITTQRWVVVVGVLLCGAAGCDQQRAPAPSPMVTPPPSMTPAPPPPAAPASARYEVTFDSTWSAGTHPADFPGDPHYSPLIGGTHNMQVTFWREGDLASSGIQLMAERGRTSPLDAEVNAAIANGHADLLLQGDALSDSPGTVTLEFDVTQDFPLVTLVTMVAPSPDWFVGVSGLALFGDGEWRDNVVVDVFAFDAGTDSGSTYEADDRVTAPPEPIRRLTGYPIADGAPPAPMGRMIFRRSQNASGESAHTQPSGRTSYREELGTTSGAGSRSQPPTLSR